MNITGVSEEEYREILENGGEVTFEIDAEDIDSFKGFEESPLIKPYLETGFELRPSPVIAEPREMAILLAYGESWTRVSTRIYVRGGSIVYRKLPTGRYEATATVPPQSTNN